MSLFKRNKTPKENYSKNAETLFDKYGNDVLRLSYSYLHNMSDAEDVLQETIIKYLETQPRFEEERFEKAWMLRVASNISKNKIKYNNIREHDDIDEISKAEEKDDYTFVLEAITHLPPNYSEVIHLFYYEGYSTREIANLINRRESTVRSDLKRGRDKLREILKEAYDFEE